jgi:protein-S-isoprenylcysteine O-methyltransferase Ste14
MGMDWIADSFRRSSPYGGNLFVLIFAILFVGVIFFEPLLVLLGGLVPLVAIGWFILWAWRESPSMELGTHRPTRRTLEADGNELPDDHATPCPLRADQRRHR